MEGIRAALVLSVQVLLAGCATQAATLNDYKTLGGPKIACQDLGDGCNEYLLPFASDRAGLTSTQPLDEPTPPDSRSLSYDDVSPKLEYGEVWVAVPCGIHYGQLPTDVLWQHFDSSDPEHLVNVGKPAPLTREQFLANIQDQFSKYGSSDTLLYVHGYADSFEDVAQRTGILTYELGWKGATVFYIWPSKGHAIDYTLDEDAVEWTEPHLAKFMVDLLQSKPKSHLVVIAHSMGTRATTRALVDVVKQYPDLVERFAHVFLFAGDMDQGIFQEQILPTLSQSKIPITIYGSSKDGALALSNVVNGRYRIGDGKPHLAIFPNITTVDASAVDLVNPWDPGHAYLVDSNVVVGDLYAWIEKLQVTPWRIQEGASPSHYWVLDRTQTPASSGCTQRVP